MRPRAESLRLGLPLFLPAIANPLSYECSVMSLRCLRSVALLLVICMSTPTQSAEDLPLPEHQNGLAAKYPGDVGLAGDPRVLFVEDFSAGTVEEISHHWESVQESASMSLSSDVPLGSGDRQSLWVTHVGGKGTGGQLYRRIPSGHARVFARFYVKFSRDCAPIHHFGTHLGGFHPSTPWPQGGAGELPKGDKRFTTGVEPYGHDWRWDFYSYWQGMRVHGDGNYWGTPFLQGVTRPVVPRDKWICVEMMVKLNDPVTSHNGEQAFWIDGCLWRVDNQIVSYIGPGFPRGTWSGGWWHPDAKSDMAFEGFNWRSIEQLTVNYLWTYVYITKAPAGHVSQIGFDNIVVATDYIGPITAGPSP